MMAPGCNGIDWLPDELLAAILSLFPLEVALQTALVCKRWSFAWRLIRRIHISGRMWDLSEESLQLILDGLLTGEVDVLHLDYGHADQGKVVAFFRRLCDYVQLKGIKIIKVTGDVYYRMAVPRWLFQSANIVELHLGIITEVLENGEASREKFEQPLTSLKKLRLELVDTSKFMVESVFNCCPVLEELRLGLHFSESTVKVTVPILCPKLKYLDLDVTSFQSGEVVVDAPNLLHLSISDNCSQCSYIFVDNMGNLVYASLAVGLWYRDVWDHGDTVLMNLLKAVRNARSLRLHGFCRVLSMLRASHFEDSPLFPNAQSLEFGLDHPQDWSEMSAIEHMFAALQSLALNVFAISGTYEENRDSLAGMPQRLWRVVRRLSVFDVPLPEFQMNFFETVLDKAADLEELSVEPTDIANWDQEFEADFRRRLFSLPRSSRRCRISFNGLGVE